MGTTAHVVVVGSSAAVADQAVEDLRELEARWSRFVAGSEVSRLNGAAGAAVAVSAVTRRLIAAACDAWRRTEGRFDPTVLPAMRANGYDRTFSEVRVRAERGELAPMTVRMPSPGCAGIFVDEHTGTVRLAHVVGFDPGGIGKGLAADVVVENLLARGADGALVNVGGDLRVQGVPPEGELWSVSVREPTVSEDEIIRVGLISGALATSTTRRRRWSDGDSERHHLLDPGSGEPLSDRFVLVGAVAAEGWWAEATTKSVLVGAAAALESDNSEIAWFGVDEHGERHISSAMQDFVLE